MGERASKRVVQEVFVVASCAHSVMGSTQWFDSRTFTSYEAAERYIRDTAPVRKDMTETFRIEKRLRVREEG